MFSLPLELKESIVSRLYTRSDLSSLLSAASASKEIHALALRCLKAKNEEIKSENRSLLEGVERKIKKIDDQRSDWGAKRALIEVPFTLEEQKIFYHSYLAQINVEICHKIFQELQRELSQAEQTCGDLPSDSPWLNELITQRTQLKSSNVLRKGNRKIEERTKTISKDANNFPKQIKS